MDLDLGNSAVFNVKVNGGEYKMSAPTVRQAQKFQEKFEKAKEKDQIDALLGFLADLGLPDDVSEKLDVVQLRKLSEGLLSFNEKK